jgi:hypothetical protein
MWYRIRTDHGTRLLQNRVLNAATMSFYHEERQKLQMPWPRARVRESRFGYIGYHYPKSERTRTIIAEGDEKLDCIVLLLDNISQTFEQPDVVNPCSIPDHIYQGGDI